MTALAVLLTLVLLGAVILFVSHPLRAARRAPDAPGVAEREALEAARAAKYREIRDAELDFRTGKLSIADYNAVDNALRAEALAILDRLAALDGDSQSDSASSDSAPS